MNGINARVGARIRLYRRDMKLIRQLNMFAVEQ